ncbi:MAG: ParA family protein, partial [Anaerolineae bacterium]|nr:ParA family protein [Anaerolineae bacterium]
GNMHVITLMNAKGGVGKTMLATYLAVGLAARGNRVLFLDSDAQANATNAFRLENAPDFHRLATSSVPWGEMMVSVSRDLLGETRGKLYVVRSNYDTCRIDEQAGNVLHLRQRLQELDAAFQYCVIDTQPSMTPLHEAIFTASDSVIIPTDCEAFSVQRGIPDTLARIQHLRQKAPMLMKDMANVLAIVPNKCRKLTAMHNRMLQKLREEYGGLVWEPIPLRAALTESQLKREFVYTAAPGLGITETMWKFVDQVMEKTSVRADSAPV